MRVHFRKRISPELLEKINHSIVSNARQQANPQPDPPVPPATGEPPRAGDGAGAGSPARRQTSDRCHRCRDRIVSISRPRVRPIVRGKLSQRVEFGSKIPASHVDGFILLDKLSWDAYNETSDLSGQAEDFRARFGHYPASIHADKIYQPF